MTSKCGRRPRKMSVDPVRGVQEYSEMSQKKAESKILIYKLVSVAKVYILNLQKKLETWGDKMMKSEKSNVGLLGNYNHLTES